MALFNKVTKTAAVMLPLLLAGCGEGPYTRGYVIDQQAMDQIKIGSSAEKVVLVLGTPSTVSTVGGKAYYYITQTISQRYQFMRPSVTDQRVFAVYLDQKNKVERVANYGMQDGRLFDFVSRTTPAGGEELSFVRQLMKASNLTPPGLGGSEARQPGQ